MKRNFVALDLGSSSGRVLLGQLLDGTLNITEAHRFENVPVREGESLRWSLDALTHEVHHGVELARQLLRSKPIHGVSCDSWGVDYVLLNHDGDPIAKPFHYRDRRTEGVMERLCTKIGRDRIFERTGIQFLPFNTIYQLATETPETLKNAEHLLMVADYFNYLMGGLARSEVTLASTTSLIDPRTRHWDTKLADDLGTTTPIKRLFPRLVEAGTCLGDSEGYPVYASASHDTAAAVAGCPGQGEDWAFLSSGTWSLLGVEVATPVVTKAALDAKLSNELGVAGTTRLLRNIIGLWPLQQCRKEWASAGKNFSWDEVIALAEKAKPLSAVIDLDDRRFIVPGNMPGKIADVCLETRQSPPLDVGETVRVVLDGLALKCRWVIEALERVAGRKITTVNMVGGGTQIKLLCQLTADACGRRLVAGPVEATAVGNILVQAMGAKVVKSLAEAREIVRRSFAPVEYEPHPSRAWEDAYAKMIELTR